MTHFSLLVWGFSPTLQNLYWMLAVSFLVFLGLWGVLRAYLAASFPTHRGVVKVKGLQNEVIILRDHYGVPTIQAQSTPDLLFGQGFAQAQDRLWQMELNRRVGHGRLAEIFGADVLPADIFLRRLGLSRAAQTDLEQLTSQERELLEAYCAGVNAALKGLRNLPLEFRLLKLTPEPWRLIDTLVWVQVMSMDLCSNWEQELLRGRLLGKLGTDGARLLHLFPRDATRTMPSRQLDDQVFQGLWNLYEEAKEYLPNGGLPGGSNAWVVSGKRTQSGHAMLANDPHLIGRLPSVWYESRLQAPDIDVQGVSFPGVPFVVIGSNKGVAWGITNSYADTQDLCLEKFLDHQTYQTEEGPQTLQIVVEEIRVKGRESHREEVAITRNGPVLFRDQDSGLSLRWMNFQGSNPVATLHSMNLAKDCSEFKEALRSWQAPSSNFVFADTLGSIGYLMAGQVPIRKKGSGLTPVPGWTDEYAWEGVIPFEELPQDDNPDRGYIVTANNPVVGSDFPHHISWDWMNPVRAQRIEEMLLAQSKLNTDDFRGMQMDVRCLTGLRFAAVCQNFSFTDSRALKASSLLGAWDGSGGPESPAMAIYQITLLSTLKGFLTPLLGESLSSQFLGQSSNPLSALAGHTGRYTVWLVQLMESPLEQQKILEKWPQLEPFSVLVERGLTEAYDHLRSTYGPDPKFWQWGFLHRLQFKHPLGVNPLLGKVLNGPVVNAGGDTDTVFQTTVSPHAPFNADAWCPSFRQVVELAPKEPHYLSVLPTGQSGHPGHRNYLDQFLLWGHGQMKSRRKGKNRELKLIPKP